jgi:hypothetical protein
MNSIAILVPVLDRPRNAQALVSSVKRATQVRHTILFLCSPGDSDEIAACQSTLAGVHIVDWPPGPGDWAKKINRGFAITKEEFVLLGADDLHFHRDWDFAALSIARQTKAGVIGTNDLGNATVMRGHHSTHPLVRRTYIEEYGTIDEPGKVVHEGYQHQWVDTELCETAMARRQWAFAADSHVEHLHPFWHKSKMDATYKKALSTPHEDHKLWGQRRHMWQPAAMRGH